MHFGYYDHYVFCISYATWDANAYSHILFNFFFKWQGIFQQLMRNVSDILNTNYIFGYGLGLRSSFPFW